KQKYKDLEFANSGENHLWMYDDYSIKAALERSGFRNIKKQSATNSAFSEWAKYNFDLTPEGSVRKPDSIYVEAIK
ncbi:MAG: methyltransferase type 11, partial [Chloroflexia bacterium]|nr:methyltransferase type 11 [Chloroflexia bacterium]